MSDELQLGQEGRERAHVDLGAHQKKVELAIDQHVQGGSGNGGMSGSRFAGGAPSGSKDDYSFVIDAVGGGGIRGTVAKAFAIAVTAGDDLLTSNKRTSNFFPGMQTAIRKGMPGVGSPLVPMSYGEKKDAARVAARAAGKKPGAHIDLLTSSRVAEQSLTGKSGGHKEPYSAAKGVKISPQTAVQLGLVPQSLSFALNDVRQAQSGPMSRDRLLHELRQGGERAEQQLGHMNAQQRHDALRQVSEPQAPFKPPGPIQA